eukprot:438621-Prymnesium_polylepis.2
MSRRPMPAAQRAGSQAVQITRGSAEAVTVRLGLLLRVPPIEVHHVLLDDLFPRTAVDDVRLLRGHDRTIAPRALAARAVPIRPGVATCRFRIVDVDRGKRHGIDQRMSNVTRVASRARDRAAGVRRVTAARALAREELAVEQNEPARGSRHEVERVAQIVGAERLAQLDVTLGDPRAAARLLCARVLDVGVTRVCKRPAGFEERSFLAARKAVTIELNDQANALQNVVWDAARPGRHAPCQGGAALDLARRIGFRRVVLSQACLGAVRTSKHGQHSSTRACRCRAKGAKHVGSPAEVVAVGRTRR